MRHLILVFSLLLATLVAVPPAAAQDAAIANMEILRQKVKADKKLVVAGNLALTDAEARKFWPVYDGYQAELEKINRRLGQLIADYAAAYNAGPVSNATAKKLINESLAIEDAELKLKRTTMPKLEQALPGAKAARYMQIENKIRAIVRYEIAGEVPLAQ